MSTVLTELPNNRKKALDGHRADDMAMPSGQGAVRG
ncbi:hypothetical protein SBI_00702 [Streptomyces bingchenggensis BCW-1]|uniref:Uncharacterized protein n=1 Tax=Streptomyces bingchenggensis (strain BCW-1) TaxID=749414 RepID=D7C2G9_STRBB|nr:hypothetical protein SBI_00702 [Streptomyces bingchenggensis BCW-1]